MSPMSHTIEQGLSNRKNCCYLAVCESCFIFASILESQEDYNVAHCPRCFEKISLVPLNPDEIFLQQHTKSMWNVSLVRIQATSLGLGALQIVSTTGMMHFSAYTKDPSWRTVTDTIELFLLRLCSKGHPMHYFIWHKRRDQNQSKKINTQINIHKGNSYCNQINYYSKQ